jgi:hypothetical protein
MRIFDLHTRKARSEWKVVLLYLWRVNVKTIRGFINIPLADLSNIKFRHNNITILKVGHDSMILVYFYNFNNRFIVNSK